MGQDRIEPCLRGGAPQPAERLTDQGLREIIGCGRVRDPEGRVRHADRFRVAIERVRTAEVTHEDMGRRVVGVTAGAERELVARKAGSRLVIHEPAVFGVTGRVAQQVRGTRLAGGNLLRLRHQQWQLVRAGGDKALPAVDGQARTPRSAQLLQTDPNPAAARSGDQREVGAQPVEPRGGQDRRHRRGRFRRGRPGGRMGHVQRLASRCLARRRAHAGAGIGGIPDQDQEQRNNRIDHESAQRAAVPTPHG